MVAALFKAFTLAGSEWVLWILLAFSILSLAIILDRFIQIQKHARAGEALWKDKIEPWVSSPTKPLTDVSQFACLESELVDLIHRQEASKSRSEIELLVSGFLGKRKLDLEKNLAFLGTVGSNAPFIGLFGTVLGIIKAFHDLGGKLESAGAQTISSGLSEALVATAVGLLVAIPAVMFFNFFQRKIKTIIGRAESLGNYLLSQRKM